MIDFSSWKDKNVKVASLVLDPKNPRVPDLGHTPSEREVIAALIEHEDVLGLAKSIVDRGGIYPSDRLIATDEDGQRIVVEGNRRLAALKLLDTPELAPEPRVKSFKVLKEQIPADTIEKVDIVLAPSRDAAAPLIADRHTGTAQRKWLRFQQMKFIRTLIGPGHTIEDVAKQIGMTPGQVLEFLRTDVMLQVASVMPLPTDVRERLQDPRSLNFSTFERLIESAAVQNFLGVGFADDGSLAGRVDEDEFKKGYTRLVTDVVRGTKNTRSLNTAEDIKEYLADFGKDTPNKQKKGAFTSESILSGKTQASDKAKKVAAPKPSPAPVARPSPSLIPKSFKCHLVNPRIKDVIKELRDLRVADYPNACAVLLRIFLELVTGHYLDTTGKIQDILQTTHAQQKGQNWVTIYVTQVAKRTSGWGWRTSAEITSWGRV